MAILPERPQSSESSSRPFVFQVKAQLRKLDSSLEDIELDPHSFLQGLDHQGGIIFTPSIDMVKAIKRIGVQNYFQAVENAAKIENWKLDRISSNDYSIRFSPIFISFRER